MNKEMTHEEKLADFNKRLDALEKSIAENQDWYIEWIKKQRLINNNLLEAIKNLQKQIKN